MIQLEDRLYTSTEVAEILGVSLRSVYRYIDENKLQAEVKTATGRHRFTKKNILDFLYPEGVNDAKSVKKESKEVSKDNESLSERKSVIKTSKVEKALNEEIEDDHTSGDVLEDVAVVEEPVDWLAKFREAARKFKEENETPVAEPVVMQQSRKDDIVIEDDTSFTHESLSHLTDHEEEKTPVKNSEFNYYRSSLGGLKDIAQNLDKNARSTNLEYAFTLNAGLSLYKPIKPFSLLHAYIKPNDLVYFERTLMLTPSDVNNAQICLITDPDESIYGNREELHGLYVVAKDKLKQDISEAGDSDLKEEAKGLL